MNFRPEGNYMEEQQPTDIERAWGVQYDAPDRLREIPRGEEMPNGIYIDDGFGDSTEPSVRDFQSIAELKAALRAEGVDIEALEIGEYKE